MLINDDVWGRLACWFLFHPLGWATSLFIGTIVICLTWPIVPILGGVALAIQVVGDWKGSR